MKTLLAIALAAVFGSVVAATAHAEEGADWGVRSAHVQPKNASARVKMAFSVRRDAAAPQKIVLRQSEPDGPPAAGEPVVARSMPWYGRDPSLQRGDVVITETGALVYEGARDGKRHFRSLNLSRLVSAEDRDTIAARARR